MSNFEDLIRNCPSEILESGILHVQGLQGFIVQMSNLCEQNLQEVEELLGFSTQQSFQKWESAKLLEGGNILTSWLATNSYKLLNVLGITNTLSSVLSSIDLYVKMPYDSFISTITLVSIGIVTWFFVKNALVLTYSETFIQTVKKVRKQIWMFLVIFLIFLLAGTPLQQQAEAATVQAPYGIAMTSQGPFQFSSVCRSGFEFVKTRNPQGQIGIKQEPLGESLGCDLQKHGITGNVGFAYNTLYNFVQRNQSPKNAKLQAEINQLLDTKQFISKENEQYMLLFSEQKLLQGQERTDSSKIELQSRKSSIEKLNERNRYFSGQLAGISSFLVLFVTALLPSWKDADALLKQEALQADKEKYFKDQEQSVALGKEAQIRNQGSLVGYQPLQPAAQQIKNDIKEVTGVYGKFVNYIASQSIPLPPGPFSSKTSFALQGLVGSAVYITSTDDLVKTFLGQASFLFNPEMLYFDQFTDDVFKVPLMAAFYVSLLPMCAMFVQDLSILQKKPSATIPSDKPAEEAQVNDTTKQVVQEVAQAIQVKPSRGPSQTRSRTPAPRSRSVVKKRS